MIRQAKAEAARTITLFQLFRREQVDPDSFYRFLADDTVRRLAALTPLPGALVLDVGGGPGYVAETLVEAGARCTVAEYSWDELFLHDRLPGPAMQADAQALPLRDGGVDVCHTSNVLEHVPDPERMLDELIRVTKPGGLVYVSFTNWLSPWGGHETSPWHYLGGDYAARRYEAKHGHPPKNRYGTSLHRVDVSAVVRAVRQRSSAVEVVSQRSRYLPSFVAGITRIPLVRELAVWNLELILRRRVAES